MSYNLKWVVEMIVISACLAGVNCKYNGGNNLRPELADLVKMGRAVPVCPEELGGLPTPRDPARFSGGDGRDVLEGRARVLTAGGRDVTDFFLRGARRAYDVACRYGILYAVLKERSPSCGTRLVYIANGKERLVEGMGVTAALFASRGIEVYSDEDWSGLLERF